MKENALQFSISNFDESKRLVFGQVYQPNKIDGKGWFMEPEEVEKMAHRYMRQGNLRESIDTNHDNVPNGCYPVQSFIARKDDPDYAEGSWVLGVKITSDDIWNAIVKGELNAFSMEIYVRRVPATVEYEIMPNQIGETEPAEDGHTHMFVAQIDENGRVIKGRTSENAGHSHEITVNSVTEEQDKHAHRYFVG